MPVLTDTAATSNESRSGTGYSEVQRELENATVVITGVRYYFTEALVGLRG